MEAVVLLGAPGSGKGTQAAKLCAELGYLRVSTGDIIRAEIRQETLLGKAVAHYQTKGLLVPDDIVCEMVFSSLASIQVAGLIFDGFPRTLLQAERLDAFLSERGIKGHVLLVDVPFEDIKQRIVNRLSCPCNAVYTRMVNGLSAGTPCPNCGTSVVVRPDDTVEVLQNRYDIYRREVAPILSFYGSQVQVVDGRRSTEQVYQDLIKRLSVPVQGVKQSKA